MTKEITLEKLAKMPQVRIVKTNKTKDKIGFYWDKTGRNEFYVLDPKTKNYQKITDGELPRAIRAGYIWLPDSNHIIYTRDKDGNEQHDLFRFNIESRKSEQLTETPKAEETPQDISPDGKYFCFTSTRAGQMNLFKYNLENDEVEQLTDHKAPVWSKAIWANDGWIYYSCNETDNLKNRDIWAVKEDGSEKKLILQVSNDSLEIVSDVSKDGKMLAVSSNAKGVHQTGILNRETDEITWLGEGKYSEQPIEFSQDSKKLLVLRNQEAEVIPIIYDVDSTQGKILTFNGLVFNIHFCLDDNYLIYTRTAPQLPQILALYDLSEWQEHIIIPPQTDLTDEDFYEMEYVKYPTFDDQKIPAILYKPKIEEGKKYPAVVQVHGGPTGQYFQNFDMFGQVFAHNGFVILKPNIRGSTGYGKEFMEMNLMDWGGGDAKDVIHGKKFLEQLDYVDPNRMGVFGGSYGGYMTFIQLTKYADASWNAGSAWIGISRLKTMYDRSRPHFKYFLESHMGTYEENKELWEDRSALNFIENIKAPVQIIHGVNDPRCPIEESRQFKEKLLEMGKKEKEAFEYTEFAEEGHGAFSDIKMRIRTFKLIIDFFKRRL
ncbi:MAG: prolyl oligopeptidase family serine peptidase [Candidatus Heimdallarchaeota archaeon]|nr:prolyl oligopeptidase family serine peptidase [Candidatus Heimdallarchaeota archaeon]